MSKTPPRKVPGWDAYFVNLARNVALRSKDPNTQVGAVLVDSAHRVLGTGYNGAPPGVDDDAIDWSRPEKYRWVLHSEQNVLLHVRQADLEGATLYVTGRPCSVCMRMIAARGIKCVVHSPLTIAMVDDAEWEQTQRIAKAAGVTLTEYQEVTKESR